MNLIAFVRRLEITVHNTTEDIAFVGALDGLFEAASDAGYFIDCSTIRIATRHSDEGKLIVYFSSQALTTKEQAA